VDPLVFFCQLTINAVAGDVGTGKKMSGKPTSQELTLWLTCNSNCFVHRPAIFVSLLSGRIA
jgi:hypothetical protein